jgi:hypothetical protein
LKILHIPPEVIEDPVQQALYPPTVQSSRTKKVRRRGRFEGGSDRFKEDTDKEVSQVRKA